MSGYHSDHLVDWSGYAHDLELFLENVTGPQKALTILYSVFSKFGLHINIKKNTTMIFNHKYVERNYNSTYPESIETLEERPIENVKQFLYLGDEVRFDVNHQLVMLRLTFESVSLKPSFMKSSKHLQTLKFISTPEY